MKIPKIYHSALSQELDVKKELDRFTDGNSIVFAHDINKGITKDFLDCDCVYSELAWNKGYESFQKRAGKEDFLSYKDYLLNIQKILIDLNKPSYIIGGKHMLKTINPHHYSTIILNGFEAVLMVWNTGIILSKNTNELLKELSFKYNKVLDFCVGYGNHLSMFKSFVASDINKKCVYFVAKSQLGYN